MCVCSHVGHDNDDSINVLVNSQPRLNLIDFGMYMLGPCQRTLLRDTPKTVGYQQRQRLQTTTELMGFVNLKHHFILNMFEDNLIVAFWMMYHFEKEIKFYSLIGFFTIRKSDAFLSDDLTDLKLHRTK